MNNGRRIDRRDAEYLRLIEALARKFGQVRLTFDHELACAWGLDTTRATAELERWGL